MFETMRNGGQAQQTAVMAPPHLNGSAQFISGGYVTAGYLPRQSWTQFQPSSQHPRSGNGRPLSLPPPPPPPTRRDSQRPCNGPGSKCASSQSHPRGATHRSTVPSVSRKFPGGERTRGNVRTRFSDGFSSGALFTEHLKRDPPREDASLSAPITICKFFFETIGILESVGCASIDVRDSDRESAH